MVRSKPTIIVDEHNESDEIRPPLSQEEIVIIQRDFKNKIDVMPKLSGKHTIQVHEYVGYVTLPNHVINIRPKIRGINFINMVRYALNIPEVGIEDNLAREAENFYDILVLFLLRKLEDLLKRGLHNSYEQYHDNLTYVRGKILFEEHIMINHGRNDRVYCQFSDLTADIVENRIIKSTLYFLLRHDFLDKRINNELINLLKRFDQVDLVPITSTIFELVHYTPLNEHYRTILTTCELLLRDSSINFERIGQQRSPSFLIDMNLLFQQFVGNLLSERLGPKAVKLQSWSYPEIEGRKIRLRPDIIIFKQGSPSVVLDTKYRELAVTPEKSELAQMVLYSVSTKLKRCVLIYTGTSKPQKYTLKEGIEINAITFDLTTSGRKDFESLCTEFTDVIKSFL